MTPTLGSELLNATRVSGCTLISGESILSAKALNGPSVTSESATGVMAKLIGRSTEEDEAALWQTPLGADMRKIAFLSPVTTSCERLASLGVQAGSVVGAGLKLVLSGESVATEHVTAQMGLPGAPAGAPVMFVRSKPQSCSVVAQPTLAAHSVRLLTQTGRPILLAGHAALPRGQPFHSTMLAHASMLSAQLS